MEIKDSLQEIGLLGKKADVYLAAIELGSASVIEIAKKAGIKRTTCYDILIDLKRLGYIAETRKAKKRLFVGEDPVKIQKKIKAKEAAFSEILPQLKSIYNIKGIKPKIKFYEGRQGLIELYEDNLNYKTPIYAFASEDSSVILGEKWLDNYLKKRVRKGIYYYGIAPKTDYIIKNIMPNNIKHLRELQLVDSKKFPFTVEVSIYGYQKLSLISAKEEIGLIVEGKEIYNTIKSIFDLVWEKTKT